MFRASSRAHRQRSSARPRVGGVVSRAMRAARAHTALTYVTAAVGQTEGEASRQKNAAREYWLPTSSRVASQAETPSNAHRTVSSVWTWSPLPACRGCCRFAACSSCSNNSARTDIRGLLLLLLLFRIATWTYPSIALQPTPALLPLKSGSVGERASH